MWFQMYFICSLNHRPEMSVLCFLCLNVVDEVGVLARTYMHRFDFSALGCGDDGYQERKKFCWILFVYTKCTLNVAFYFLSCISWP